MDVTRQGSNVKQIKHGAQELRMQGGHRFGRFGEPRRGQRPVLHNVTKSSYWPEPMLLGGIRNPVRSFGWRGWWWRKNMLEGRYGAEIKLPRTRLLTSLCLQLLQDATVHGLDGIFADLLEVCRVVHVRCNFGDQKVIRHAALVRVCALLTAVRAASSRTLVASIRVARKDFLHLHEFELAATRALGNYGLRGLDGAAHGRLCIAMLVCQPHNSHNPHRNA